MLTTKHYNDQNISYLLYTTVVLKNLQICHRYLYLRPLFWSRHVLAVCSWQALLGNTAFLLADFTIILATFNTCVALSSCCNLYLLFFTFIFSSDNSTSLLYHTLYEPDFISSFHTLQRLKKKKSLMDDWQTSLYFGCSYLPDGEIAHHSFSLCS